METVFTTSSSRFNLANPALVIGILSITSSPARIFWVRQQAGHIPPAGCRTKFDP
jgi:hypothetical protein